MNRFIHYLWFIVASCLPAEAMGTPAGTATVEIYGLHLPVADCAPVAPTLCRLREGTDSAVLLCEEAVEKLLSEYRRLGKADYLRAEELLRYSFAGHSPAALRLLLTSPDGRILVRDNAEEIVRRYADEIIPAVLDDHFGAELADALWRDLRIQDQKVLAAAAYAHPSLSASELKATLESLDEPSQLSFVEALLKLVRERGARPHVAAALNPADNGRARSQEGGKVEPFAGLLFLPAICASVFVLAIAFNRKFLSQKSPAPVMSSEEREELRSLLKAFNVSPRDATIDGLTRSYHQIALTVHPDGSGSGAAFSQLVERFRRAKILLSKRSRCSGS